MPRPDKDGEARKRNQESTNWRTATLIPGSPQMCERKARPSAGATRPGASQRQEMASPT
jgi:hypothetical protein